MNAELKIAKAKSLAEKKKFDKALQIIKKNNKSTNNQTFASMLIEGLCYRHRKNYQLAESAYKKAKKFAQSSSDELSLYQHMVMLYQDTGTPDLAIDFLEKQLAITGVPNNLNAATRLCSLAFAATKYKTVIKYAKQLLGLEKYWVDASLLLAETYHNLGDKENSSHYIQRIMDQRSTLTEHEIYQSISQFLKLDDVESSKNLLASKEKQYGEIPWFKEISLEIENHLQKVPVGKSADIAPLNRIISDDSQISSRIEEFLSLLETMGAYIHNDIRICAIDGELSIKFYSEENRYVEAFLIPLSCMPLINDFDFTIDDSDTLKAVSKRSMLNPNATKVMANMVDIFNLTGKITHWKSVYPQYALRHYPDVINELQKFKNGTKSDDSIDYAEDQNWDEVVITSFLSSRAFVFEKEQLAKAHIYTERPSERGLLTIMDFLNHRFGEANFLYAPSKKSLLLKSIPEEKSKEVFVQYNLNDLMSCYLKYGFVDSHYKFLHSIPCTFKLASDNNVSEVIIENSNERYSSKLPEEYEHLKNYLPVANSKEQCIIHLSHIAIPDIKDRHLLKESILFILTETSLASNYQFEYEKHADANLIEKTIIEKNIDYWGNLKHMIITKNENHDDFPRIPAADILQLCDKALARLKPYC